MYQAKTIPEAVRQFEIAALPHISAIVTALGVPFENHRDWRESKNTAGHYYRNNSRDRIHFDHPTNLVSARRKRGETVPVGQRETELLTVNEGACYGYEYQIEGGYEQKRHTTISDSTSSTLGWSVAALIEGQAGGGESSGGSYLKTSLTTTVSGEESKGHNEEEGEEWSAPFRYSMTVPADQGLRVVQTVESGESKQYITDLLELDLAFWVVDWKHLKDGSPLSNNADWKGYKDTKSRYVMQVESIDDLRVILTGQSREYPGFKGLDWTGRQDMRGHVDWLLDKDNRTVKIDGAITRKGGLWGGVKPQLV